MKTFNKGNHFLGWLVSLAVFCPASADGAKPRAFQSISNTLGSGLNNLSRRVKERPLKSFYQNQLYDRMRKYANPFNKICPNEGMWEDQGLCM